MVANRDLLTQGKTHFNFDKFFKVRLPKIFCYLAHLAAAQHNSVQHGLTWFEDSQPWKTPYTKGK